MLSPPVSVTDVRTAERVRDHFPFAAGFLQQAEEVVVEKIFFVLPCRVAKVRATAVGPGRTAADKSPASLHLKSVGNENDLLFEVALNLRSRSTETRNASNIALRSGEPLSGIWTD